MTRQQSLEPPREPRDYSRYNIMADVFNRTEAKRLGEAHYMSKRSCGIKPVTFNALMRRKFCIHAAKKDVKDAKPAAPPPTFIY